MNIQIPSLIHYDVRKNHQKRKFSGKKKGIKQKARFWIKKLNNQFSQIGLDVYHHHSIMFKQHKRKLLMFLQ